MVSFINMNNICPRCGKHRDWSKKNSFCRNYCRSCYEFLRVNGKIERLIDYNSLPTILSEYQIQYLDGLMLGDGGLWRYGSNSNPKLLVDRALDDKQYLLDNFYTFQKFCRSGPRFYERFKVKTNKNYYFASFSTLASQAFLSHYKIWYPNKLKVVPRSLNLSPLTMAIWFCDDGTISTKKNHKYRISISFATNGFLYDDVCFLASLLASSIGEKTSVVKTSGIEQWYIYLNDNASRSFISIIDRFMPSSMIRKAIWRKEEVRYYNNQPARSLNHLEINNNKLLGILSSSEVQVLNFINNCPNVNGIICSKSLSISSTRIYDILYFLFHQKYIELTNHHKLYKKYSITDFGKNILKINKL